MIKYSQIILIFIILLTSASLYKQSNELEVKNLDETKTLLDVYSSRVQTIVDGTIKVTSILEELIILNDGEAPLDEVIHLSRVLFDDEVHINIAYAPDGVISYAYPPEGNEAAIGHNLLEDPQTKKDSTIARDTGKSTLSKPYVLRQGRVAAVVRDPIYIEKDGKKEFWGFIAVAMRTSEGIILHSKIDTLERFNYEYHLSYYYDGGENIDIVHSKGFDFNKSYLTRTFETKYGLWELSIYRNQSVSESVKRIIAILLFVFSFGYIVLYCAYKLRNPFST